MYESSLLSPGAPLTCTPTVLTWRDGPAPPDRSSKCEALQLIRLFRITSHVRCDDFTSSCWGVLLYRFSDLKCNLAPEPQLVEKLMSHKPNASDSYLFIHSVILPFLFFFEFLGHTCASSLTFFLVVWPVSPRQPSCPTMFVNGVKRWSRDDEEFGRLLFFSNGNSLLTPSGYPTSPTGTEWCVCVWWWGRWINLS